MPIALPDLDDRGYAELLDEARTRLPALAPAWTDHNPSDPGITLLELFAWVAEMVVWRTNQLPDANLAAFLALLNGHAPAPGADLDREVSAALATLREGYRAVTAADYERLSTSAFNRWLADAQRQEAASGRVSAEWAGVVGNGVTPSEVSPVARARCVPRRKLDAANEDERTRDAPGEVSVLVLPARPAGPAAATTPLPGADGPTRQALWGFLEQRRLLGTRVHVLSPVYVPVRVEAVVVRRPDAPDPSPSAAPAGAWDALPAADVRRRVLEKVAAWLDPLRGGPGGSGWPFGGDVHASDLYALLEAVPGVEHVAELRLSSPCPGGDPGCVAASEARHPETGEQVGLALAAHHLPRAVLDAGDVRVARAVVPVGVQVSLLPAAGVAGEALERAVGAAVRGVFSAFGGGPDGNTAPVVEASAVLAAVRALPQVDGSVEVRLDADPDRLLDPSEPNGQAVRFVRGEIAGPELSLNTEGKRLWA